MPSGDARINIGTDQVIQVDAERSKSRPELFRYPPYSTDAEMLKCTIDEKLGSLAPHTSNYGTVCIYKVPPKHRNMHPQAYTPRSVSIGPLHYGKIQLQGMEEYKLKYLSNFLNTFRVPTWLLATFVQKQDKLVRTCYESSYINNLKGSDGKLSEVILLDGVFMIELFLKNHFLELRESGDIIFENSWVLKDVSHDLLLFENQLPLGFLTSLYNNFVLDNLQKFMEGNSKGAPSFVELAQIYFKNVGNTGKRTIGSDQIARSRHLVEFLAIIHTDNDGVAGSGRNLKHGDHDQKPHPIKERKRGRGKTSKFAYCPNATELSAAGVRFTAVDDTDLFRIDFNPRSGELKIPKLLVNDLTETFFCNLIAFEQTGYDSRSITSYAIQLDNLIDTAKDVDILIKHKIIKNQLVTSQQVADVFNNLYKEVVTDPDEFSYVATCRDLNAYKKTVLHRLTSFWTRMVAGAKDKYFNSPLSTLSIFAATIVILLTITQTACGLISTIRGH